MINLIDLFCVGGAFALGNVAGVACYFYKNYLDKKRTEQDLLSQQKNGCIYQSNRDLIKTINEK